MSEKGPLDLQTSFIRTGGGPIPFGTEAIVQGDRWELDHPAVIEVRFLNDVIANNQSVRLSFKKRGKISLTDGQKIRRLEVIDDERLPRFARHLVEPKGESMLVYNAYEVERMGYRFWESFTGNAGMIVTQLTPTRRIYECSSGVGAFDRSDLKFSISVLAADAPWLPHEIYGVPHF